MLAPEPFLEPRGTPLSVLGRLKALSTLGHQVDLVVYSFGRDVSIEGVSIHRTPKIPVLKSVKVGPSWTKVVLDTFLLFKAWRLLSAEHYDLLYTHEEAGFLGTALAKVFRVPHLYEMHSSPPAHVSHQLHIFRRPLLGALRWLEKKTVHSCNAIVTICPALAQHVAEINPHVPHMMIENTWREPDGDQSPETVTRPPGDRSERSFGRVVLYVGTFEPYQGLDLLFASAEKVLRRRKDVIFVLVGGTTKQVRHRESQVRRLGLSDRFEFPGTVPPEQISKFMARADVLLSPRISGRNTPSKIYTYLRSDKPIVATNLTTHTQVLSPEVAVLVEPSAQAMANGILSVLSDNILAKQLVVQAQKYYREKYPVRAYVEKTEKALEMATRGASFVPQSVAGPDKTTAREKH